ncbi:hypothetical protein CHH28_18365 [Bacterioplanes sanyensis]|uniref:Uncharacterized protein n=1 Tax=Bacterioplanes sanyensis TaxID=1249553 RepID=A0A222FP71_9GAMM|nr:hypothetical protein [Bacterioplanes sanyensis]ASP40512.1 hypothetical protein CHH28_18365 [Bacterioplanes sanyensis]
MNHSNNLIQPLVEHLAAQADLSDARRALAEAGVFSNAELMAMDAEALKACYKTLRHTELKHSSSDEVLKAIDEHQACWPTDLSDDFKQGAISY